MGLLNWVKDPGLRGELLWTIIRSEDPDETAEAIDWLRDKGWLTDSSMRGVDLHDARLQKAPLSGVDFQDADFETADLREADFTGADLSWATFDEADMTGADFEVAWLHGASLARATLEKANLHGADLSEADLHSTSMAGADIREALLHEADLSDTGLTEEQLLTASTLAEAVLPDGKLYDGRYNLSGDIAYAQELGYDLESAENMAVFYNVPVKKYEAGQEWARKNKPAPKKAKPAKKAAAKPAPAKDVTSDEADGEAEPPGTGILEMLELPFSDPELFGELLEDEEQEESLRKKASWVASVLMWLPTVIATIQVAAATFTNPERLLGGYPVVAISTVAVAIAMVAAAIPVTAQALRARGRDGAVPRSIAILLSLMFAGGYHLSLPVQTIACVIALLLAYQYLGRSARITLFWVGMLLIGVPIHALVIYLLDMMGITLRGLPVILALGALRLLLGLVLIIILRYWVRNGILPRMGARRDNAIIRELDIGYLIGIGLTIWAAINAYALATTPRGVF